MSFKVSVLVDGGKLVDGKFQGTVDLGKGVLLRDRLCFLVTGTWRSWDGRHSGVMRRWLTLVDNQLELLDGQ